MDYLDEFWLRTKILTKHRPDSVKKLKELFEWQGLKKNHKRRTVTQLGNKARFTAVMKELFDVARANAQDLITNEDDKLFLQSQRKKGRPGCMGGVDKITERQEAQKKQKAKRS